MKTKTFGLFVLSIFALIFLMSGVSAVTSTVFTITDLEAPTSVNQEDESFTFTFNLTYTGSSQSMDISFEDSTSSTGDISIPTAEGMNGTIDESRIITGTISNILGQAGNTADIVINATSTSTRDDETTFSVEITSEHPQDILDCQATGNPGNLEVKKIDFTNNGLSHATFGEDDEWFPFEEIEVEVQIESDDYDIDDISFEWGIYSLEDKDWLIDLDEEDEFNLKDGDKETFTITFKLDDDLDIDLDEFVDNADNYRFYVIATGTIDDDNSPDDGEDTCDFDYESVSIVIERDFVILDNIRIPETLKCGETATITADVWNIGDREQDEVSVSVFGRESALGFSKTIEVGDIDEFDKQVISFTFTVPKNLDEKFYALNFEVNDEDGDVYESDFGDDPSEFTVPFKVEGNCGVAEDVTISATLESEAKAGKEMVIRATVTNNGDELKTLTINAAEFATWADLISQDQNTLVLNAGQSRDVLFTFDVKKDASGSQTFFIEAVSDGDAITQPVSVNIEASRPFLGIITGFAIENASPWGLGLLNIILIVIIVIVAVKIARRK